jgi:hypothetical protein
MYMNEQLLCYLALKQEMLAGGEGTIGIYGSCMQLGMTNIFRIMDMDRQSKLLDAGSGLGR